MATASPFTASKSAAERRKEVMLGELPSDFLRLSWGGAASGGGVGASGDASTMRQIDADAMAAQALANQLNDVVPVGGGYASSFLPSNTRGRLSITIVEAKLTKNYGIVRMDPYCRLRVGNTVFETPTNVSGAKNPKWNRTVHCYLPLGVETMYLEMFDERAFTTDERIAWAHLAIPPAAFNIETIDDWFQLSGPQGEAKEGTINLIISFAPLEGVPVQQTQPVHGEGAPSNVPQAAAQHVNPAAPMQQPAGSPTTPAVPAAAAAPLYTDEDVSELLDMFPAMEAEVVRSVLDEKRGNKDAAVNALLSMSND